MKKMAYLICASGLLSSTFLYAATATRMNNTAHWTGWYSGLNLGGWKATENKMQRVGGTTTSMVSDPTVNPFFSTAVTNTLVSNSHGVITGLQVAYNYEHRYTYLVGFEADIQYLHNIDNTSSSTRTVDLPSTSPYKIISGIALAKTTNTLGTFRARAGYMVTPKWLAYGTGGVAIATASLKVETGVDFLGDPSLTRLFVVTKSGALQVLMGWTAGGGIEWMYKKNWIARIEGIYVNLPPISKTGTLTQYTAATHPPSPYSETEATLKVPFNEVVVRAAISHRFS